MGVFQNNLMGAAAAASAGGGDFYDYQIANSCRFNGTSSRLNRTPSSTGNRKTLTLSTWVKRSKLGANQKVYLCGERTVAGYYSDIGFETDDTIRARLYSGNTMFQTTQVFRDTSAWYHIVMAIDTTQGTADNRCKLYINGERVTAWATDPASTIGLNYETTYTYSGTDVIQWVGAAVDVPGFYTNGYFAETYLVDGTQLAIGDTGETKNGVWIPKDPSGFTYGTNGFLLNYASSGDMGNDVSGNNNDFTPTSVSAHDQMLDSPTFGSEGSANFPAFSPLYYTQSTNITEGNLDFVSTGNIEGGLTNAVIPAGEATVYYFEWCVTVSGGGHEVYIGVNGLNIDMSGSSERGGRDEATCWGFLTQPSGYQYVQAGSFDGRSEVSLTISTGDVVGMVIDRANTTIKWYINNSLKVTSTNLIATGDLAVWSGKGGGTTNVGGILNAGQDSSFAGQKTAGGNADSNGFGDFFYTPPTGTVGYCTGNLPVADAVDPAQTNDDYPQKLFSPKIYTGTGSSNALTGLGFQPDLTWIKERSGANDHKLTDSTRGVTKSLESNEGTAEATDSNGLTAFGTDGFTVGSDVIYNNENETYVSWNWRLNGGTTSSNTEGALTSTVQVDPSGGFSIAKYTSNGSGSSFGHGLAATPSFLVVKKIDNQARNWAAWHKDFPTPTTGYMLFNLTNAVQDDTLWNNTAPTSTVINVQNGTTEVNNPSGDSYICYSFTNIEGYIKSGSYEGNGNADGTFVYTGFRPALIMTKSVDSTSNWQMFDDTRVGYNVDNNELQANTTAAEVTTDMIDILSNGFKLRIATDPNVAETYVYLAMAHNPFKYATAR